MIFGTITNGSNEATKSLSILGKSIKNIVRDYRSVEGELSIHGKYGDWIGGKKIAKGFSGILGGGISDSDLNALKEYNRLILNNVDSTEAYAKTMLNAGTAAQTMAKNSNGAVVSLNALTVSEKAAAIGAELMSAALNAALTFGASLAIQAFIKLIYEAITAEQRAREEAIELRKEAVESINRYNDEENALNNIRSKYVEIAATTSDLTSKKESLSKIQDEVNEKFKEQKEQVDLLNNSLTTNLHLMEDEEYRSAKKAKEDIQTQYDLAKEQLESGALRIKLDLDEVDYNEAKRIWDEIAELGEGQIYQDMARRGSGYANFGGLDLYNLEEYMSTGQMPDYKDQLRTLDLIIEKYGNVADRNTTVYDSLIKQRDELRGQYDDYEKIVAKYDELTKIEQSHLNVNQESSDQLDNILTNAQQKISELNQATNLVDKFEISQEINNLRYEANQLADDNVVLTQRAASVFDAYSQGFSETLGELSTWREAWFKTLDEVRQGGLKNVEMMQNALSTLMSGEGLSGDDFWKLAELDTDKILSDVQMIGDKFYLNENQVIQLKDAYINKNVEQLKSENQILLAKKKQAEIDALSYQNQLDSFSLTMLDVHNPRYAEYNQQFEQAKHNLDITNQKAEEYGEHLRLNNVLVAQWESGLGAVAKTQDAINKLAKKFQEEADNRLKAQEYKVDQIVDGIEAEKSAIEDAKAALEDQLSILKEQEDELKEITENYEKVANTVQSAIKEQIDNLKAQNEEREEALSLAEKLANLENAKNNKVRTYTEAGGWQYEAKKSDVEKAQREVDKAKVDQEIKVLEEYLKKWEDVTGKRQKAEDEQLAEQILGADWRQKIAKQDEGIFNKYEEEYESYGNQLNRISNIEMQTLQKEIDIKNKEIAAKEAQIKEWQKYKSAVQKAASDAKAATSDWYQYLSDITLNEDSTLDERNKNLEEFAETYSGLVEKIAGYTRQIGDMTASISFDTSGLEDAAEELEEFFNAYREGVMAMADAYNADENHFGLVNSEWDAKLLKAAKGMQLVHSAATGRVVDYTGLLAVHGTKQKSETIFNANDSKKLYDYIHNTPNVMADMITGGYKIAQNLPKTNNDVGNAVTFNGTVINLPNVQNAEQFARQMESYMQTVLTESQVYKPRR